MKSSGTAHSAAKKASAALGRTLLSAVILMTALPAAAREVKLFDADWLFTLNPKDTTLYRPDLDDASWRRLSLPHDWAIEGDFYAGNPSKAMGGALPGGMGWYRKHFSLVPAEGRKYFITFDGVYMNSDVWLNGHHLGNRPYGYSTFSYDITPHLNASGDNVIAVRVNNTDQPNSRWYSGCGIYRHVWLTETSPLHIAQWGAHVVADGAGNITVEIKTEGQKRGKVTYLAAVYDKAGRRVASGESSKAKISLRVNRPRLWSTADPYTYRVVTTLRSGGKTVDEVSTLTGFRSVKFDAVKGFFLNGKSMKLNGVCDHHDMGCFGAALREDALHRQLSRLRDMGVNAIRCSHNPPAPELLNMCDTMGFLVMDESFDMWRQYKTPNDYARFFDKWHERDLSDLVLRDRNHPSVIMWSIGNEVGEQWNNTKTDGLTPEQVNILLNAGGEVSAAGDSLSSSSRLTRHLASIIRRYDTTRPVTAGCNNVDPSNHLFRSGALDIIGFNYHNYLVKDVPKNFPGKPFILSESVSALQTRGFYRMPSDSMYVMPVKYDIPYTDPSFMCSSYDNSHALWSNSHEETWDIVKHTPYCGGQFIWTGWDYLGEPTPYDFPARSSNFGIIDLAGFPKDVYYMYQSEWTDRSVLHLFPHWNWIEGQTVDMWCYYNNADEVELFINGKSQGVRRKENSHQYHVMWRVRFIPGEVKVVARKDGKEVGSQSIRTAGPASSVRLSCDYSGKNTVFINAEVTDSDGNLCPLAEDDIHFLVSGGDILGVDNGSPVSMERFKADHRKAFFGKAMIAVGRRPGEKIEVRAVSATLRSTPLSVWREK